MILSSDVHLPSISYSYNYPPSSLSKRALSRNKALWRSFIHLHYILFHNSFAPSKKPFLEAFPWIQGKVLGLLKLLHHLPALGLLPLLILLHHLLHLLFLLIIRLRVIVQTVCYLYLVTLQLHACKFEIRNHQKQKTKNNEQDKNKKDNDTKRGR